MPTSKKSSAATAQAALKNRQHLPRTQGLLNALIADEIRRTLGSKRMSQSALARASGMHPLTVGRLLSEQRPLSLNQVDQLAEGMDMTGTELVASAISRVLHAIK